MTLFPKWFTLDVNAITMSKNPPVENGASAIVYHGHLGKEEVAVKQFRLYFNTMKRVKKASLPLTYTIPHVDHLQTACSVFCEGSLHPAIATAPECCALHRSCAQ